MSQDKFKRNKILHDNDHSMERDYSANSYIEKDDRYRKTNFIYNANILKRKGSSLILILDEPLKLNAENMFIINNTNNNISFEEDKTQCIKCEESKNVERILFNLERNLDELLKSLNQEDKNKMIINSKKYSMYKKIFEEVIKVLPPYGKILERVLIGFNEVIANLATDNKVMSEKCKNFDSLSNSNNPFKF